MLASDRAQTKWRLSVWNLNIPEFHCFLGSFNSSECSTEGVTIPLCNTSYLTIIYHKKLKLPIPTFMGIHLHLWPTFVSSPAVYGTQFTSSNFPLLLPFGFITMFNRKDLSLPFPIGQLNLEEFDPIVTQSPVRFSSATHNESHLSRYKF